MRPPLVLLVEDEPVIALDVQHKMERDGYRVLWAGQHDDVVSICDRHRPDLAVVNFRQEGIDNGMALARQLRTRFGLQVHFLTGARVEDLTASACFDPTCKVLYKPFTRRQLSVFIGDIKNYSE